MVIINNFNRLKLIAMKHDISLFEKKMISLKTLIDSLDALYREMSNWCTKWDNDFYHYLLDLESVYAGSIEKKERNQNEEIVIIESLFYIKKLIEGPLIEYNKHSDSTVSHEAILLEGNYFICPVCNESWRSNTRDAMIICPNCSLSLHNPIFNK